MSHLFPTCVICVLRVLTYNAPNYAVAYIMHDPKRKKKKSPDPSLLSAEALCLATIEDIRLGYLVLGPPSSVYLGHPRIDDRRPGLASV